MSSVFLLFGDGSGWNTDAVIIIAILVMAVVVAVHVAAALATAFIVGRTNGLGQGCAFRPGILAGMGNLAAVLLLSHFGVFLGVRLRLCPERSSFSSGSRHSLCDAGKVAGYAPQGGLIRRWVYWPPGRIIPEHECLPDM